MLRLSKMNGQRTHAHMPRPSFFQKKGNMSGCAAAVHFGVHVASSAPLRCDDSLQTWTAAVTAAHQQCVEFDTSAAQNRQAVLTLFEQLKQVLERLQWRALNAFDTQVNMLRKRLAAQAAAVQVRANVLAVGLKCAPEGCLDTVCTALPAFDVPVFVHVPINDVEAILAAAWSVETPSTASFHAFYAEETLAKFSNGIKRMETSAVETARFVNMAEMLSDAMRGAKEREKAERANLFSTMPLNQWKGQVKRTYTMDFLLVSVALSWNASLFAVAQYKEHWLSVHQVSTGELVAKFGTLGNGPGQFHCPARLCFTPHGTLLVADSKNKRVQEVTITGNYVRSIRNSMFEFPVFHVTCSVDKIVVAQGSVDKLDGVFCVYDMSTGQFLRSFGNCGSLPGQVHSSRDTTFSCDGTTLMVADNGNKRISAFDITGNFLYTLGDKSTLPNVQSLAELPDGRVVTFNPIESRLVIFPKWEPEPTCPETSLPTYFNLHFGACTSNAWNVRFANGVMLVTKGKCVQVITV